MRTTMQIFDYSLLKGRIVEKFGTAGAFAEAMGFNASMISARLRSGTPWKDQDIFRACKFLDIRHEDIPLYFFTPKF